MHNLEVLLNKLTLGIDGIYSYQFDNHGQADEVSMRDSIAHAKYTNYLEDIANYHSISVMDTRVDKFVNKLTQNSIIIDVGGCWGWHWRNVDLRKKNMVLLIVDLVRHNLYHAQQVLKPLIESGNVVLIHGNATDLPFPDNFFDAYWSVQTLQHIPNIEKAIQEGYRILKKTGYFVNYTLNDSPFMRFVYKICNKKYHVDGYIEGKYFLRRSSIMQSEVIEKIFKAKVEVCFSEIIFQLEFKTTFSGKQGSVIGKLDSFLTSKNKIAGVFARQIAFYTQKK